jgi:uncharacterized protein
MITKSIRRGNNMVSRKDILDLLSRYNDDLRNRFSVRKIGLFGSYVRDEALPGSDVDVLVEFIKPTFDNYMDLKFYLEELFQTPVDLVIADALKPRVIPYIMNEIVYA